MSPWQELGIEPTGEAALIRKAYATRLKQTRPEDDPAGFVRLRAAYEAALAMAPQIAARPTPDAVPIPPAEPRDKAETASEFSLTDDGTKAIRDVIAALEGQDTESAARLLHAASTANLLPLRVEFGLKSRLAAALLADRTIDIGRLIAITTQFGWYGPDDSTRRRDGSIESRLRARIDAELQAAAKRDAAARPDTEGYLNIAVKPPPSERPAAKLARLSRRWAKQRHIWITILVLGMVARFFVGLMSHHQPFPDQPPTHAEQPVAASERIVPTATACTLDAGGRLVKDFAAPEGGRPEDARSAVVSLPRSMQALAKDAAAGSADAQYRLGLAYFHADGIPRNLALGTLWFRRAALQGHPRGRTYLAIMCASGWGTPKDMTGARHLFSESAQLDDPLALSWLGGMAIQGEGGPEDLVQGFAWTKRSALLGDVRAMAGLGQLYADGTGTGRDLVKAAAWRHAAAAAGDSAAMFAYGNMALNGEGMAPRPVEAYRWLALAALRAPEGPERTAAQEALAQPALKMLAPETRQIMDMTAELWQPAAPSPPEIDAR